MCQVTVGWCVSPDSVAGSQVHAFVYTQAYAFFGTVQGADVALQPEVRTRIGLTPDLFTSGQQARRREVVSVLDSMC